MIGFYDTAQEAIKEVHERYMELSTLIFLLSDDFYLWYIRF